ncbi:hypothetical protein [Aeromonas hydrophila]|uniref:hypothetical protein n=1 Tax=Aeromonas hydrophila TaxID=644 RepID=UPI001F621C1E|nr:hypothetical protein [Aeromonas hydrophila]UNU29655.1 hypothetical protein GCK65_11315 [Aeromonas hydrophila]
MKVDINVRDDENPTVLLGSAVIDGKTVKAKDFEYISNTHGHYYKHGDLIVEVEVEVEIDQTTKKGSVKVYSNQSNVDCNIDGLYIGNNVDLSSGADDYIS